jgi:hypothetical protein
MSVSDIGIFTDKAIVCEQNNLLLLTVFIFRARVSWKRPTVLKCGMAWSFVHHGFACHEVLVVLCNILIVYNISVNVYQLMGMFDINHKIRLQEGLVHSVKFKEINEVNG